MSDGIDLLGYLTRWRADLVKAADMQRKNGMDILQAAEVIEADIADLDIAIAALEPAPATEEASGDLIDAQTCDEVDPRVSWNADAVETDQPEVPEVEETLPGDEVDEHVATIEEVVGWNDAQNAGFEGSFDEYVEAAAEPTSVLNDPELIAAVDRANASIAQDEPKPYVGCIDEELERDYDAAKARTTIKHEDAKKPFFAFLGAKPKPEEVC